MVPSGRSNMWLLWLAVKLLLCEFRKNKDKIKPVHFVLQKRRLVQMTYIWQHSWLLFKLGSFRISVLCFILFLLTTFVYKYVNL